MYSRNSFRNKSSEYEDDQKSSKKQFPFYFQIQSPFVLELATSPFSGSQNMCRSFLSLVIHHLASSDTLIQTDF